MSLGVQMEPDLKLAMPSPQSNFMSRPLMFRLDPAVTESAGYPAPKTGLLL